MADQAAPLDAQVEALPEQVVEPDSAGLARAPNGALTGLVDKTCADAGAMSPSALRRALEDALEREVRARVEAWRQAEERALARCFEALCARFQQRGQALLDRLAHAATPQLGGDAPALPAASAWRPHSGFSYKFWRAPPSIELTASARLTRRPMPLAGPLLWRWAKARALGLVGGQAGRLHHDFDQRLRESTRAFLADRHAMPAATEASIDRALQRGQSPARLAALQATPVPPP